MTMAATNTPAIGTKTVSTCGTETTYNGTVYCTLDVTDFAQIPVPGYASMNESFDFDGVLFQIVCPSNYSGCPGQAAVKTIVPLGVVEFELTFPDGTTETLNGLWNDAAPPPVLSVHSNPVAGFEIVGPFNSLRLVLLVQAQ
jgi:hypothetical protein